MYLLDSDILINNLKGRVPIPVSILESDLFISIINYIEFSYGNLKQRNNTYAQMTFLKFLKVSKVKVLPIDKNVAKEYLSLRLDLESIGLKLEHFDLFIAATALVYDLTLVTNNKRHFERIKNLKIA
jgi:predicted nucleic acid-binding protein